MDCMQIYKSIPIITAQPSLQDQKAVPHFLYGFAENNENLSFGKWVRMLEGIIKEIQNAGKMAIIVGGTMMYFYLLLSGYSDIPEIPDSVRENAGNLYREIGHEEFLSTVQKLDKNTPGDRQRLIYNYCLITHTGNSISYYHTLPKKHFFCDGKPTVIIPEKTRQEVYNTCNSRFLDMIRDGLFEEIRSVIQDKDLPIKRATGFHYIVQYLCGEISKDEAIAKSQQETRNYAKRQIIWLRKFIAEGIIAEAKVAEKN